MPRFGACFGRLIKYNKPMSKGKAEPMLTSAPLSARVDRPALPPAPASVPARVDRLQSSRPCAAQLPVSPVKEAACPSGLSARRVPA